MVVTRASVGAGPLRAGPGPHLPGVTDWLQQGWGAGDTDSRGRWGRRRQAPAGGRTQLVTVGTLGWPVGTMSFQKPSRSGPLPLLVLDSKASQLLTDGFLLCLCSHLSGAQSEDPGPHTPAPPPRSSGNSDGLFVLCAAGARTPAVPTSWLC